MINVSYFEGAIYVKVVIINYSSFYFISPKLKISEFIVLMNWKYVCISSFKGILEIKPHFLYALDDVIHCPVAAFLLVEQFRKLAVDYDFYRRDIENSVM